MLYLPRGGGGGAAAEVDTSTPWTKLTSVEQASGTPVDPGSIGGTGTGFNTTTGRATVVCTAHVTLVDGYQENLLRWSKLLTDLYADFDPEVDTLEICVDLASWPHGTAELGVFFGVADSSTVDANLVAAIGSVRQNTALTDTSNLMAATSLATAVNVGLVDEAYITLQWAFDGTNWVTHMSTRFLLEDGRIAPGSVSNSQVLRGAQLANWRLTFGVFHASTDSLAGLTVGFDVYHRRWHRDPMEVPQPTAAAKVTSGTLNVLIIGDSIADGFGADPTGTGGDGLAYGGSAVPAGVTVYDDGVSQANWQDNGGSAPDPGLLPHIAETALSNGFTAVNLYRWAVIGNLTNTIRISRLQEAITYLCANSITPHLVVLVAGSNDSQTGESATFATEAPRLLRDIERTWPDVRVCWVEPIPTQGTGAEEVNNVRSTIQTQVALKATRSRVAGVGVSAFNTLHPSLQGYRDQGRAIIPAYLAGG